MSDAPAAKTPRVVIVGAGFAGLAAAKALRRLPVSITLIDRRNHHLFQPLLYQVATAALSVVDVATAIRRIFSGDRNVEVLMERVVSIDLDGRRVRCGDQTIPYDNLVLATGSAYSYFGHDEWKAYASALKTAEDALEIRRRILTAFERAESTHSAEERRRLLNFVVVGGGPTGVELAGSLAELARFALARDFRRIDPGDARIVLVEGLPQLLGGFAPDLSAFALETLRRKGVEVILGERVEAIGPEGVTVGGKHVPAATVLWAAGTAGEAPRLIPDVPRERGGRVRVGQDLALPGRPEVFVCGDLAFVEGNDGKPLPGLAPVATQQGKHVARVMAARLRRQEPPPFRYRNRGTLATIGRGAAIADLRVLRLRGWVAWVFWWAVHIYFLIGARNRTVVFLNWAWAYFTYRLGARVITDGTGGRTDEAVDMHPVEKKRRSG